MLKFRTLTLVFLMLVSGAWAQVQTTEKDWCDKILESKNEIKKELGGHKAYSSKVLKIGLEPAKLSIDISGQNSLVLITSARGNRINEAHCFVANGKLYKENGTFVYLNELEIISVYTKGGVPIKNKKQPQDESNQHGIYLYANAEVKFNLNQKYVKFEGVVGIDEKHIGKVKNTSVVVKNVSTITLENKLLIDYPEMMHLFLNNIKASNSTWLSDMDATFEKLAVSNLIEKLNYPSHFRNVESEISKQPKEEQLFKYLEVFTRVKRVYDLQMEMQWVTPQSLFAAYENMKTNSKFNSSKFIGKLAAIESLYTSALAGMYLEDQQAIENIELILKYKKEILLANPLLDFDQLLIVRYNLGKNARSAMGPKIGTQNNNWSVHTSMKKTGFDCELALLSNLRGEIKSEQIYKSKGKAPLTNLKLHWDADRLMFTSVNENDLWQLFELDMLSKKVKQLTQVPEDDLHFFDGTYLPNGKIIVSSNIGYQGVPCVNGSSTVGNLCLYDPENNDLRRLSFGQDNDWSPEVMNNGRVMQLRWEYTDNTHYFSRIMLHMNPDGTTKRELYGSGSYWPNAMFDAKPLPGKNNSQFIAVVSGHHGIARSGRLVLFDPKKRTPGGERSNARNSIFKKEGYSNNCR